VAKSDQVGVPRGFVRVYHADGIEPGPGGIHLQCDIGISGALFSGFGLGVQGWVFAVCCSLFRVSGVGWVSGFEFQD